MRKGKMEKALNKQLDAELYSSCLYLSVSTYFESINPKGFANWIPVQARLAISETDHATINFLQWFVDEKVEEESSADEIQQKTKSIGEVHRGPERGHRVFTLQA